jgi:hypothetical protein
MSETIATEHKWIVQYQPCDDAPWICDDAFPYLRFEAAEVYLERQRERRPGTKWRLVHRVTVTTVTEEVVR